MLVKNLLQDALSTNKGLLVGKIGTIECSVIHAAMYLNHSKVPPSLREILEKNAGVFPNDDKSMLAWAREAKEALYLSDCLALGWYENTRQKEEDILQSLPWNNTRVNLRSLEPYYPPPEERWTNLLEDQEVCVVTSFTQSAQNQVKLGEEKVWPGSNGSIWPTSTKWHWVQTGYAPILAQGRAGWEESPESWHEAVVWVVEEVLKTKARIVLIGCGGLGLLIGAKLKQHGKICMVLGGSIQVLFGIKGRRWEHHDVISKFWNPSWTWPREEEIPRGASEVEKSCYWK